MAKLSKTTQQTYVGSKDGKRVGIYPNKKAAEAAIKSGQADSVKPKGN